MTEHGAHTTRAVVMVNAKSLAPRWFTAERTHIALREQHPLLSFGRDAVPPGLTPSSLATKLSVPLPRVSIGPIIRPPQGLKLWRVAITRSA